MMLCADKIVAYEEGFRSRAYHCSEGYATIGYGRKLSDEKKPDLKYWDYLCVTKEDEAKWMVDRLDSLEYLINDDNDVNGPVTINSARMDILVSMAYQLGYDGLRKFKNMWAAIYRNDWDTAAKEALDSKWAKQTPNRAKRHADVLRSGTYEAYNGLV